MPGGFWRRMTAYLAWQRGQPKLSPAGAQLVRRCRMRCRTALLWVVIRRLALWLDRRIAAANLGNTVSVLAIVIIDRLHIEEHELLPGIGIGSPRFRIQLELFFDKNRHCVGIIGNNPPQVVVSQL